MRVPRFYSQTKEIRKRRCLVLISWNLKLTWRCSLKRGEVAGPGGFSSSKSSVRTITPNTMKNMTKMKKLMLARSFAREVTARARHFIVVVELAWDGGRCRARLSRYWCTGARAEGDISPRDRLRRTHRTTLHNTSYIHTDRPRLL